MIKVIDLATPEPLNNMVHYNRILDLTRMEDELQMAI